MSDQMLVSSELPDEVLDAEEYVLGDDAAAALKELWGLGDVNETPAEHENGAIFAHADLSLDVGLLDLPDLADSAEIPDWLRELDPSPESPTLDLDF